jgi:hypothetical protein
VQIEELYNLHSSTGNIIAITSRRTRWPEYEEYMGTKKSVYKVSVGKPDGNIPIERPSRRWEDIIKINLREIVWDDVDWVYLAGFCEHGNETLGSIKCFELLE